MGLRYEAHFIALCVGGGDAFLIDREREAILVDGVEIEVFLDSARIEGPCGALQYRRLYSH
jgi:hypothetical protein